MADSVNSAVSAEDRAKAAKAEQLRVAILRAIQGQQAPEDVKALLQKIIEANAALQPVNQTVIAFDVQQFSERLSAVENRQYGQVFGTLADSVVRGQVLRWNESQQLVRASADNLDSANKIVGFADQSGTNTQTIRVIRSGVITNPEWSMTPNQLLFLGLAGEPTQEQVGLFSQAVGFVLTPTSVFVNTGRAVIRS